jgi:uncharacterized surface protein with fasciclin (FAS1) repeats
MKKLLFSLSILALSFGNTQAMEKNIVGTAVDTASLSTLVAAVQAADLVDTLSGAGPFTVFAPTNEAFAALGTTLDEVLLPENKDLLTSILTYHVIAGSVASTDLVDGMEATTVNGQTVIIDLSNGVMVNEANVVMADVMTTNGIVHVIDAVLIPAPEPKPMTMSANSDMPATVVDIALGNSDFSNLVDAVVSQGLVETLQSEGPFTVFAPTNEAFSRLPMIYQKALMENPAALTDILLYHVVPGKFMAADVLKGDALMSAQGGHLQPFMWRDGAFIEDSRIIATDIEAGNGVVHVIDRVLVPREIRQALYRAKIRAFLNRAQ